MQKKKSKPIRIPSAKTQDQPATRQMLALVRQELVQRMDSGFTRCEGEFQKLRDDMHNLRTELRGEMQNLKGELRGDMEKLRADMKADFQELKANNTKLHFLMEEQNANNRIVLEGLQLLWQRQLKIEAHLQIEL